MSTKVNPNNNHVAVTTTTKGGDWRVKLFGDKLRLNTSSSSPTGDVEQGQGFTQTASILQALDGYEYLALFFGANYCPFCKEFAPSVVAAAPAFEAHKTKVIFVSNDRDEENYEASCMKVKGIDVMDYDLSKTAQMRDLFGLKTIPALMILQNKDFHKDEPFVVSNAREILELDSKLERFPWGSIEKRQAAPLTAWERLFIHGIHGNWWQLGHKNVSPMHPKDMYMDEHAVRIRAGLLNVITWVAIINVFYMRNLLLVNIVFGIVSWEFVTSMLFGLTPFAPLGIIATLIAVVLQPSPLWKPANPKRFAWGVGLMLALTCFIIVQLKDKISEEAFRATVAAIALTCNLFTWLESAAGFCVGCFVYNNVLVKYFGKEECKECKL
jgi:thiol-disulfide isomerase/thioredoxin